MSDVAGTTRDTVDTTVEHDGKHYTIVDTAGLRRKSQIDKDVEYYSFVRAMRAIDRANVALLVIDATLGLTDQDQRVAGYAAERGCAMVILLNKRDAVESGEVLDELRDHIDDRMVFVGYAPVISISALTGKGVQRIWDAVDLAYENYATQQSTAKAQHVAAGHSRFRPHHQPGQEGAQDQIRHADARVPARVYLLLQPSRLGEQQLRALLGKPFAPGLRFHRYAYQPAIQEERLTFRAHAHFMTICAVRCRWSYLQGAMSYT